MYTKMVVKMEKNAPGAAAVHIQSALWRDLDLAHASQWMDHLGLTKTDHNGIADAFAEESIAVEKGCCPAKLRQP